MFCKHIWTIFLDQDLTQHTHILKPCEKSRRYNKKVTGDPRIAIGSLVDDFRAMYGIEVDS